MIDSPNHVPNAASAVRLRVTGVVQGVGFRPFVHRLALRHALAGWVRNRADGVEIAIEGNVAALDAFIVELHSDAPSLARIDDVLVNDLAPERLEEFRILESADASDERQPVAPDVAMCDACERELYDPANRRFRYPFITCTDCGPRYSVIERMPYDRERTSMRAFAQCPACLTEYHAPGDRRYHSETNSCPACGPSLTLIDRSGAVAADRAALVEAARLLSAGRIVAVRGLGGFHLAVDATSDDAVARLRRLKHRDRKPLAVMVRSLAEARMIADLDATETAILTSRERPIVVVARRAGAALAASVAPGMTTAGVMLPYTPLHHLLYDLVQRPLVMTSGNMSDEPICAGIEEAQDRLRAIADAFLVHDREIVARVDDSVMRVVRGGALVMRRARGIAPLPVALPIAAPVPILAVGAHLKSTVTLADEKAAYVSPHIGDLDTLDTLRHFRETVERIARLHRIDPQVVVHDLHPGYLSTAEAMRTVCAQRMAVQHHHAHIAAVCAEHGVVSPVVGVAYDGTGLGDDGTVWGAEILVADLRSYERVAHLRQAPLPGGDLAVRTPWRAALGYLTLEPQLEPSFGHAFRDVDPRELGVARRQAARGINAPLASSMGRLFDAAAAILGVQGTAAFEGQAAMRLEALAGSEVAEPLPLPVRVRPGAPLLMDPLPLLAALGECVVAGQAVSALAAAFHEAVAAATAAAVQQVAGERGLGIVALGGGTFQNARLVASLATRLEAVGLRVLTARQLPANDGAISYGQAAIAAARLGCV